MHTFCQIIHKNTSETKNLYHYSTNQPNNNEFKMEFCRLAYDYEYKPDLSVSFNIDLTNRLLKTFFHIFVLDVIGYSVESKFSYFKKTIDNIFITPSHREEFILRFCKIQKAYWSLNRAVYNYKWRKAQYRIQTDLILNPINESQHNVITIMHNNNKYLFTVFDLRTIIEGSLTNSPYMFACPVPAKNPYNNLPFDKATLYNIYFFMKRGNFVLSNLFHNYFLCDFNLTKFKYENEVIIRKKYIEQYVKTADINELFEEGIRMLKMMSKYSKRLKIDLEFPKQLFVDIMRPYLKMFFSHIYSLDICARNNAACDLNKLLKRFYFFNPQFGRKYIKLVKGHKGKILFNDKHIDFNDKYSSFKYNTSHMQFNENNYSHDIILEFNNVFDNNNNNITNSELDNMPELSIIQNDESEHDDDDENDDDESDDERENDNENDDV